MVRGGAGQWWPGMEAGSGKGGGEGRPRAGHRWGTDLEGLTEEGGRARVGEAVRGGAREEGGKSREKRQRGNTEKAEGGERRAGGEGVEGGESR